MVKCPASASSCARNTASNRKSPSSSQSARGRAGRWLEHLVGFLEHERLQRIDRLLAIPGAAVRRPQRGHDLDEAGELGGGCRHGDLRHDRMTAMPDQAYRAGADVYRVRRLARQHRGDPLRRPARSAVRRARRAEPRRRRADDRDPALLEAEDPRQPHGRGAPGARAGALRAAAAVRRGHRAAASASSSLDGHACASPFSARGTSHGVPAIGCDCAVCRSADPRDRRTRPSILIDLGDAPRHRPVGVRVRRGGALHPGRHRHRSARAGAGLRRPPRRCDPLHAQPRRSRLRPRRSAAVQRDAAVGDRRATRDARHARRPAADVLRTSSTARRARAAALPQLSLFRDRRRRSRSAASRSCPVPVMHGPRADSRLPDRLVRLPDRLQSTSRTRRGRCSPACARWSSTRCAIVRTRRISASTRRSRSSRGCGPNAPTSRTSATISPHAETCARLPAGVELAYDGLVLEIRDRDYHRGGSRRPGIDAGRAAWCSGAGVHGSLIHGLIHFPDDPRPRAGRSRCSRSATSTACTAAIARSSTASAASPASAARPPS